MRIIDDRYQVLECVDRKERSELFRVEDRLRPGRILMLKLLRPSGEDEQQAFANDFRMRVGLRHHGIARVFELGTDPVSGAPYYTGEWIGGELWDAVAPWDDPPLLARLCADVCATLAYCHARDLLHLDLKPDNLLVVEEQGQLRAKVLDFGLAMGRSREHTPGGTPTYMAPELLEGRPFDRRADLYALGISMLPPSRRPDVPGHPSPRAIPDDWPRSLAALVKRLIARNADERVASARAVLEALERSGSVGSDHVRELLDGEAPFVGRGVTTMRLREAFRRHFGAEPDAVSAVLLVGEPGIGKTRLMREFRASVTTAPPVVVGGDPYADDVPFPPLGDPLARLWQRREIRQGPGVPHGRALAALLPGLTPPPADDAPAPRGHEELVRSVTDFLVAVGQLRPGTLFLDDLDRGDPLAPRIVAALLAREDNPWFVVATAREPIELPSTDRIVLGGLDVRAVEGALRARFGEVDIGAELVTRLHGVSGGNPAFFELLIRQLRIETVGGGQQRLRLPELGDLETPADLAASIRARQASLPAEQRSALGFLALASRPLGFDALCTALETEPAALRETVDALVDQGLLRRDGTGADVRYRFEAEHHAAATYASLTPARQRKHHRAMAELLRHADDVDDLRDLARHLEASGQPGPAAEVLLRAARRARARFDHPAAEAMLRRALFTAPPDAFAVRAEVGLALGDLLGQLGRYRAAGDAYRDVERLDPAVVGAETMGRLARVQGGLAIKTGERGLGLSLLERAVGYLEGTTARADLARAYKQLTDASMADDSRRARHYCDLALENLPDDAPPRERAALHLASGELAAMMGDYETGLAEVRAAVEMFRAAGAVHDELTALDVLGRLHRDTGDAGAALEVTRRAVRGAERSGDWDQYARLLVGHGDGLWQSGEYGRALETYLKALEQAVEIGHTIQEATARKRLGRLYSYVGSPDRALEELGRSILLFDASNDRLAAGEARVWQAATQLRAGELEELDLVLDRAERDLSAVQLERGLQAAAAVRGALRLRQGRHDEVAAILDALGEPLPEVASTMHRLWARYERLRPGGDLPAAYGHAQRAVDVAEGSANPDARWRSLAELCGVCLALDDREQALVLFRQLQQLADWIQQRVPEGVGASHPVHRAVGRLARELDVVSLPAAQTLDGEDRERYVDRTERVIEAMRELSSDRSAREQLGRLLSLAIEVVGAERGLLRLSAPGGDDPIYSPPDPFPTSEKLLEGVMRTGQATWTANAAIDERFADSDSVTAQRLRSVLCAPLRLGARLEGVLYVDHPFVDAAFGPRELKLLEVIAAGAALVARSGRLHGELQRLRSELEALRASPGGAGARAGDGFSPAGDPAAGVPGGGAFGGLPQGGPAFGGPAQGGPAQGGAAFGGPAYGAGAGGALPTTAGVDAGAFGGGELRRGQLGHSYDAIIGEHPALVLALQTIDHIVDTEIPVYVHGESGTGKELFARAIHDNGPRADGPFMALNCAAVPEQLLESELFGHVRGAFTGATADRKGLFEMASGGTLFLDEVGDMSMGMQSKLLRVLQEQEVRRVGSARTIRVDVRVVAASHRDLAQMVVAGEFRQDVYYRLCAITVNIPALRERHTDVPLLLQHFLAEEARERGAPLPALDPQVLESLTWMEWPGNVRQLRNVVRTAWALGGGRRIGGGEVAMAIGQPLGGAPVSPAGPGQPAGAATAPGGGGAGTFPGGAARGFGAPTSPGAPPAGWGGGGGGTGFPASGGGGPPFGAPPQAGGSPGGAAGGGALNLADRERQAILAAIAQAGGNKVQAAKILGISRRTLYRKIERYGLKDEV